MKFKSQGICPSIFCIIRVYLCASVAIPLRSLRLCGELLLEQKGARVTSPRWTIIGNATGRLSTLRDGLSLRDLLDRRRHFRGRGRDLDVRALGSADGGGSA